MADQAEEPLIGRADEEPPGSSTDSRPDLDVRLLEQSLERPGLFVWLLTLSAGISGLLFGCM